jgi:hypothetical protein
MKGVLDVRQAFGIRISSELPLPELDPADAGGPDVEVRLGPAPAALDGATAIGRRGQATADAYLLDLPGIARFLVRDGAEIVVDLARDAPEPQVKAFLLGTVLGALCYQRGLLPLHANAVAGGGRCVAIAGPSGSGKSTLGAWLGRAGYGLIADDVCAVGFDAEDRAWVRPGVRQSKLWSDALAELGHEHAGLERVADGRDKYLLRAPRPAAPEPIRFERLYLLGKADDGPGGVRRLGGTDALKAVIANLYRFNVGVGLGRRAQIYAQAMSLIGQAEVYLFKRRWGFEVMADGVEMLERHLAER